MWKQVQPRKGRARTRSRLLCLEVRGSSGLMGVIKAIKGVAV